MNSGFSRAVSSEVKRPSADADAVVTTRRQSYVRMGDPENRKLSLGRRRSSGKEDVWDVTMDIEEEVEYVPWAGLFLRGGVCTLGRFVLERWSMYLGQVCS